MMHKPKTLWRYAKRFVQTVILLIVVILVVAIGALFGLTHTDYGRAQLLQIVLSQARAVVPGLTITSLHGNMLAGDVRLSGFVLRDINGNEAIGAKQINLRFRLLPLLSQRVSVNKIEIVKPTVVVRAIAGQKLNVEQLFHANALSQTETTPPPATQGPPWTIAIGRFALSRGSIRYEVGEPEAHVVVQDLAVGVSATIAGGAIDAKLDKFSVDVRRGAIHGRVTAHGNVHAAEGQIETEMAVVTEGILRTAAVDVQIKAKGNRQRLNTDISIRSKGAGELAINGWGGLDEQDEPQYALRIEAKDIVPDRIVSGLPRARINLSLVGEGHGVPMRSASQLDARIQLRRSTWGPWRLDQLVAHAVCQDESCTLKRLQAAAYGTKLAVTGKATRQQFEATVALDAPQVPQLPLKEAQDVAIGAVKARANLSGTASGNFSIAADIAGTDIAAKGLSVERLSVNTKLRGTNARPRGELAVSISGVRWSDGRQRFGPAALDLKSALTPKQIRANALLALGGIASSVKVHAAIPLRFGRKAPSPQIARREPLRAALDVKRIAIQRALRQLGLNELARGTAQIAAELTGTLERPHVTAAVSVNDFKTTVNRKLNATAKITVHPSESTISATASVGSRRLLKLSAQTNAGTTQLLATQKPLELLRRVPAQVALSLGSTGLAIRDVLIPGIVPLDGNVLGTVKASGTLRDAAISADVAVARLELSNKKLGNQHLTLAANMRGKTITASGDLVSALPAFGTVRSHIEGQHRVRFANVKATVSRDGGDDKLAVSAQLAGRERRTLSAKVKLTRFDLAPLEQLVADLRRLRGRVNADFEAHGLVSKPVLKGSVAVTGASVHLRGAPALDQIKVHADVTPTRVVLRELSARSDGGTITAKGTLDLADMTPRRFASRVSLKRFPLDVGPLEQGKLDANIQAKGDITAGLLSADVAIDDGVLGLPQIKEQRDLLATEPLTDVVYASEQAQTKKHRNRPSPKTPPHAAKHAGGIVVRAKTDTFIVRSEEINVEAFANVEVRLGVDGRPRIKGEAGLRRGSIKVLDNELEVRRAEVKFSGGKQINPYIHAELLRKFADANVIIVLSGLARKPKLTLLSEPAIYDESQILSLLLTGRVDLRAGGDSGGMEAAQFATAATQALLGPVLKRVGSTIGLDVTRVRLEESREKSGETRVRAEAEIGKHISNRFYVAYRRVFGAQTDENANEGLAEIRLSARWLFVAVFGDRGVGNADVVWTYRY